MSLLVDNLFGTDSKLVEFSDNLSVEYIGCWLWRDGAAFMTRAADLLPKMRESRRFCAPYKGVSARQVPWQYVGVIIGWAGRGKGDGGNGNKGGGKLGIIDRMWKKEAGEGQEGGLSVRE